MPKLSFGKTFPPNQETICHCGHCGFKMWVTPTQAEYDEGFSFFCINCGWQITVSGRNPKPVVPKAIPKAELKSVSDWLNRMMGCRPPDDLTARLGSKFAAQYRRLYKRQPSKDRSTVQYSLEEFRAIVDALNAQRDPIVDFLREWK